jgi:hypothetical protein
VHDCRRTQPARVASRLRQTRRREGRYLLRTNLCAEEPAKLWKFYLQLVEVEAAFKNLQDDLQLRPIHHGAADGLALDQMSATGKLSPVTSTGRWRGLRRRSMAAKTGSSDLFPLHLGEETVVIAAGVNASTCRRDSRVRLRCLPSARCRIRSAIGLTDTVRPRGFRFDATFQHLA